MKILQNAPKAGGLNFPDIELELQAYFLENITNAIKDKNKQWIGMLKYELGNELRNLDIRLIDENSRIITKNKEHADIITRTMIDGLRKIKNKVNNWQKLDHQKITKLLRKNVQVTSTAGHADNKSWSRLRRSSKNLKRLDLNYLVANTRLPLANFLSSINVTNNSRCRLCGQEPETQEHLFFSLSSNSGFDHNHKTRSTDFEQVTN